MPRSLLWHYLGDISTALYRNREITVLDVPCNDGLDSLPLSDALDPGNFSVAIQEEHGVIQATKNVIALAINANRRKSGYPWDAPWPDGFEIKVRSDMPSDVDERPNHQVKRKRHMFILGPNHLVLPWPFENLKGEPTDKYGVEEWKKDKPFDPTTDLVGDILLSAGDFLVTKEAGRQLVCDKIGVCDEIIDGDQNAPESPLDDQTSGPTTFDVKDVLETLVQNKMGWSDYSLPITAKVIVDTTLPTNRSRVELNTGVTLVLGFKGPRGSSSVIDLPFQPKEDISPWVDTEAWFYAQWPCGAFGP